MSIEIVSIGNEVLRGMILNTNTAYLSRKLAEEGWNVERQTTLPDETEPLVQGLKEITERCDVAIATGGLGPTLDDNSLFCAQKLFKKPPEKIANPVGSAFGCLFKDQKRVLILLPGIPQEMEAMFEKSVIPFLKKHLPVAKKLHKESVHFCLLREDHVDPLLRKLREQYKLDIGIYPGYGTLSVVVQGPAQKEVQAATKLIAKTFEKDLMPSARAEESIHHWMQKHKKTLAFAESCTGGFMSAQVTAMPGASEYFLGSLVTYADELKEEILNVPAATIKKHGAVSGEVVLAMWKGLMKKTGADYGIAVSGIAGPTGGTAKKPVGTVWFALGRKGKEPVVDTFHLKGSRTTVILRTTRRLFALLWKYTQ
jgi:nicotinamide-nucleotide amidase